MDKENLVNIIHRGYEFTIYEPQASAFANYLNNQQALLQQAYEALKKYRTGVEEDSPVMQAWDNARKLLLESPKSDLARIAFEAALSDIEECAEATLKALEEAGCK